LQDVSEYPVRRVMVTGSRDWDDKMAIDRALFNYWYQAGRVKDILLIEGGARGADELARICWETAGFHTEQFPADWATYGKRAGIIRNLQMLDTEPEHVLAFINNNSRGASHAAAEAERRGIPVTYFREDTAA
jgi:anaerobic selenocysteine-containing dehydrogenase